MTTKKTNESNSLKVERIRELMIAHQEVTREFAELYESAETDHEQISEAKREMDAVFARIFRSYFPCDIDYSL